MRDDLLGAQASVDWAVSQIPAIEQRFKTWLDNEPYRFIAEPHPEMGKTLVKLAEVQDIPSVFNAEVGSIINSLRSGLDLLAVAVAKRYSVLRWHEMYFPIADSAATFAQGDFRGQELIKALPADAADIFKALKPYAGGNDSLFALHQLDITRKHRRLIAVRVIPEVILATAGIEFPAVWPGFKNDAVFAWHAIGRNDAHVHMPLEITFDEAGLFTNRPVVPTLHHLAAMASKIIQRFDNP